MDDNETVERGKGKEGTNTLSDVARMHGRGWCGRYVEVWKCGNTKKNGDWDWEFEGGENLKNGGGTGKSNQRVWRKGTTRWPGPELDEVKADRTGDQVGGNVIAREASKGTIQTRERQCAEQTKQQVDHVRSDAPQGFCFPY